MVLETTLHGHHPVKYFHPVYKQHISKLTECHQLFHIYVVTSYTKCRRKCWHIL